MIILFILGLLLGAFAVIFALQNISIITVNFLYWELTGSLALILLVAISCGALVAVLILLPEIATGYFRNKSLKKENERLEEELRKQKELTVFAKNTPPTEKEINKIEQGVIDTGRNE